MPNRCLLAVLVVAVAVLGGILNLIASMAADVPSPLTYESTEFLLNPAGGYNVPEVPVPRSTGFALRLTDYVFNSGPFSFLVRKFFVKSTQFHRVRFLADQIRDSYARGFPLKRLSQAEHEMHAKYAKAENMTNIVNSTRNGSPFRSVVDFHRAFLSKKTKPSKMLANVLEHARKVQEELRPFKTIFEDLEIAAAASDKRFAAGLPLSVWDGVPIAVKDEMAVLGSSVSLGRDPNVAAFHIPTKIEDPIVTAFRKAGAIIIGITVMHEIGISALGWNKHVHGPFNAYDSRYMSGGSTGGCAVVVATGIVPVCLGYDGGGSLRIPAAWNGVFGFAPTFGRVPSTTLSVSHFSTIHCGPIAATAIDTALAYHLMATVQVPNHIYTTEYGTYPGLPAVHLGPSFLEASSSKSGATRYLSSLKVGVFSEWSKAASEPHVLAIFEEAMGKLFNPSQMIPFEIPHLFEQQLSHGIEFITEMALVHQASYYNPNELPLESASRVSLGMATGLTGIDKLAAQKVKGWSWGIWEDKFRNLDIIVLPTQGSTAYPVSEDILEEGVADSTFVVKMVTKTFVSNLHGYPAVSVPIGLATDSLNGAALPVGLQVMCKHWDDHVCLTVAAAIERAHSTNRSTLPKSYRDVLV